MTWSQMMLQDCGYETKTTFWDDFSIADAFGLDAIKETFDRAFAHWKNDVVYLTELVLVLNHKLWSHYQTNPRYGELYETLWSRAQDYAYEHLKGDDLTYFCRCVD